MVSISSISLWILDTSVSLAMVPRYAPTRFSDHTPVNRARSFNATIIKNLASVLSTSVWCLYYIILAGISPPWSFILSLGSVRRKLWRQHIIFLIIPYAGGSLSFDHNLNSKVGRLYRKPLSSRPKFLNIFKANLTATKRRKYTRIIKHR